MSNLYSPSQLEAHLITHHGIKPGLIGEVRTQFETDPAVALFVAEISHKFMHSADSATHDHDFVVQITRLPGRIRARKT